MIKEITPDDPTATIGTMGHSLQNAKGIELVDVFLSYSTRDSTFAHRLVDTLEMLGLTVWWDRRSIDVGSEYSVAIGEALAAASCVLVLWSAASVDSRWVRDEATYSVEHGRLVPATIDEGVQPPLGFRQIQTANLAHWDGSPDAPQLTPIVASIMRITSAPHKNV